MREGNDSPTLSGHPIDDLSSLTLLSFFLSFSLTLSAFLSHSLSHSLTHSFYHPAYKQWYYRQNIQKSNALLCTAWVSEKARVRFAHARCCYPRFLSHPFCSRNAHSLYAIAAINIIYSLSPILIGYSLSVLSLSHPLSLSFSAIHRGWTLWSVCIPGHHPLFVHSVLYPWATSDCYWVWLSGLVCNGFSWRSSFFAHSILSQFSLIALLAPSHSGQAGSGAT